MAVSNRKINLSGLARKLVVDGLVGPRTLILLYQVAGAYDMPRLS